MKTKFVRVLIFATLLVSCSKDDITVTLKTDGSLSVRVTDSEDNSIANTKVILYIGSTSGACLDELTTTSSGVVDFGDVLAGTYAVVVDTPKVDGIKYKPSKLFQVTSGSSKNLTINVQEYVGTLTVKINKSSYLGGGAFADLDVILVPNERYSAGYTVATLITKAEFSGKTDSQGVVTFSNPSGRDFRLIVYNSRKTRKNALTTINLLKEEVKMLTYSLDTSLVIYK